MTDEKPQVRPWGKERTERLAFRVTKAEHEALKEQAKENKQSVSDYLRSLIRKNAEGKTK